MEREGRATLTHPYDPLKPRCEKRAAGNALLKRPVLNDRLNRAVSPLSPYSPLSNTRFACRTK